MLNIVLSSACGCTQHHCYSFDGTVLCHIGSDTYGIWESNFSHQNVWTESHRWKSAMNHIINQLQMLWHRIKFSVCKLLKVCAYVSYHWVGAFNHNYVRCQPYHHGIQLKTKLMLSFLQPLSSPCQLGLLRSSSDSCLSFSLLLSFTALPPPASHDLICHIYNGNIQIYRCYQLITSALITIQLTSVFTRHAAGRPAPSLLNHSARESPKERRRRWKSWK